MGPFQAIRDQTTPPRKLAFTEAAGGGATPVQLGPKHPIEFTDRLASLANYRRMKLVAGRGMRGAVAPTMTGRGAFTAWTPERQSHHDAGAYEAPLVLNLPAILKWWTATALHRALQLRLLCGERSAFAGVGYRAWRSRLRGE